MPAIDRQLLLREAEPHVDPVGARLFEISQTVPPRTSSPGLIGITTAAHDLQLRAAGFYIARES